MSQIQANHSLASSSKSQYMKKKIAFFRVLKRVGCSRALPPFWGFPCLLTFQLSIAYVNLKDRSSRVLSHRCPAKGQARVLAWLDCCVCYLKCVIFIFLQWVLLLIAWVSGVSGEKGKNGSEKGREVLSLLPLPPPPSKISSSLAP